MKATDLMIGDWVSDKISGTPGKISELYSNSVTIDNFGIFTEDMILPILLTSELLEKNGWEWDILDKSYVDDNGIFIYRVMAPFSILNIDIEYVHELQHILKLLKIDKEIKL